MKNTNHTPGPWEYVDCGNEQDVYIVYQKKERGEAIVQLDNEHNARLIAAAPDLLEALEIILGNMREMGYSVANESLARAAIAKARGQS